MKPRHLHLLLILLTATVISCRNHSSQPPSTSLPTYQVHDIRQLKKAEIEIGDRVFLETSANCIMGYPQKIVESKGILFIFSQQEKGTIFLFKKSDGRFIRKINHVGKGPGEYTKLRDFDLDPDTRILYLLDDNQRVLVYSMEDVLQREIRLAYEPPADFYNLAIRDQKILIDGMDNDANSLYQFSMEGKFEKVLQKSAHLTINQPYPFTTTGLNLYFHKKICDTIFIWRKGNFEPYLFLDFGKYSLTGQEVFEAKKQKGNILSGLITKPNYRMGQFREAKSFSYFDISALNMEISATNYFHCFYRKSDQTVLCSDHSEVFSKFLPHAWPMLGLSEDQEYILNYASPVELYGYRDEMVKKYGKECLKSDYKELDDLCNGSKIDDNPVILYIKLREDLRSKK